MNTTCVDFQVANQKFLDGDGIDDSELGLLLRTYRAILSMSECLGPEFRLYNNELRNRMYTLESYERARKEKY